MPAAVPATPPKPKIAAIIAITRNVNAHPNMVLTSDRTSRTAMRFRPTPRARPPWGADLLTIERPKILGLASPMKTLLRHTRTGLFLQGPQSWTSNAQVAYDFRFIDRALHFVDLWELSDVELAFAFD